MRKAFRDAYDRELAILKERSAEFAAEYPGLAERLGGLLSENLDPGIAGLLEGTAFLAARVQLNMEEEFRTFTHELLGQVFPSATSPVPSAMLVQARPPVASVDLSEGLRFAAGEYLDARYNDAERRVTCRFQLRAPLEIWPLGISGLRYHAGPGPVGALGQDVARGTKAGLVIEIGRLSATGGGTGGPIGELPVDSLPVHLIGPMADAVALYEQIHCGTLRASLRYLDGNGDPVFRRLRPEQIAQIGFEQDLPLIPSDGPLFHGFTLLREGFVFPRKFLGFRLTGLGPLLAGIRAATVQLVFEFDRSDPRLAARLEPAHIGLHIAPAVNLFEEFSSQVRLDARRHEFVVTPDSSPMTHYEFHRLTEVHGHFQGNQPKVRLRPLYALPEEGASPAHTYYYTTRQKPRRPTAAERRQGKTRYRYRGTETYIAIYEPPGAEPLSRLQVRGLASNRHLTEYLPIGQGRDDFMMCEDQTVTLTCVAGPTPPREALTEIEEHFPHRAGAGDNYWRLISYLSLGFHGLQNQGAEDGAAALREMLSLFANLADSATAAQVAGLRRVDTRPVVRTIRQEGGFFPARGLEVRLTFDEDEFEGSGVILMGAILDRFLAEYAGINSFTQCIVASLQRGTIKTWPPRSGAGPLL